MNTKEAVAKRILELCEERNMAINALATVSGVSIRYGFLPQLPERDQQRVKNEFNTQFQAGRFAYRIYNEHEVGMLFSEFFVVYATI